MILPKNACGVLNAAILFALFSSSSAHAQLIPHYQGPGELHYSVTATGTKLVRDQVVDGAALDLSLLLTDSNNQTSTLATKTTGGATLNQVLQIQYGPAKLTAKAGDVFRFTVRERWYKVEKDSKGNPVVSILQADTSVWPYTYNRKSLDGTIQFDTIINGNILSNPSNVTIPTGKLLSINGADFQSSALFTVEGELKIKLSNFLGGLQIARSNDMRPSLVTLEDIAAGSFSCNADFSMLRGLIETSSYINSRLATIVDCLFLGSSELDIFPSGDYQIDQGEFHGPTRIRGNSGSLRLSRNVFANELLFNVSFHNLQRDIVGNSFLYQIDYVPNTEDADHYLT